jgi:hypothetical protein
MTKMTQKNAIAYVLENCEIPADVKEKLVSIHYITSAICLSVSLETATRNCIRENLKSVTCYLASKTTSIQNSIMKGKM